MLINLGERTHASKFPINADQMGDMVIGVTDIATGATHVQHSPGKDKFSPKLKPKQMNRSSSNGSGGIVPKRNSSIVEPDIIHT